MLNNKLSIYNKFFDKDALKEPTRDGYGKGLLELGATHENVVALCADLAESTRTHWFKEKYPDRYIEVGVAEQNLAGLASGLANYGKIPFISSYASFSPGRNNEQIRTNIALSDLPVKIVGAHSGVSVGPDGATHQALEDIALMRVMPNMTVIVPCDAEEARKATLAAVTDVRGPAYIRLTREKTPTITTKETPFMVGKANVVWESEKPAVAIVAAGPLLGEAMWAAHNLDVEGVGSVVINMHTIKPLDKNVLNEYAKKCGAVVTVEEHQVAGGLGGAVAEHLALSLPVPIEFVGVRDRYGQSGTPDELLSVYGLTSKDIKLAAERAVSRK